MNDSIIAKSENCKQPPKKEGYTFLPDEIFDLMPIVHCETFGAVCFIYSKVHRYPPENNNETTYSEVMKVADVTLDQATEAVEALKSMNWL